MSATGAPAVATSGGAPGREPARAVGRTVPGGAAVAAVRRGRRRRSRRVHAGLALGAVAAVLASLSLGAAGVPLPTALATLLGPVTGQVTGAEFVVLDLRLPRAVAAATVGGALGLSGALLQSLARNPLASPDLLGITTGASVAAVVAVLVVGAGESAVAAAALVGGLVTAALLYALAWRGGVGAERFVLVGIGVGTTLHAVIGYLLTRVSVEQTRVALRWLYGSLSGTTAAQVLLLAAALVVLVPAALALSRPLEVLATGEDAAASLGLRVQGLRTALLALCVGLAALATATAGPVAFVALVAAPVARRLLPGRAALGASALVGALLVLVADVVGQHAAPGADLPVSVVTGLVGGPYLLWLVARAGRRAAT